MPEAADQQVSVGIRPEGFVLQENGPLCCKMERVEVMGRDITVLASHEACTQPTIRAIISSEEQISVTAEQIHFAVKPGKIFLFSEETEERLNLTVR